MAPSCNVWSFGGGLWCGYSTLHHFVGRQWHFRSIDWILRDLPATFSEAVATSVHFWSINGTFRPPLVQCRQLPAAFGTAVVPSIKFQCIDETLQQLLVRGGKSRLLPERQQTFCQLSVHPRVRPSTFRASEGPSVNFPCVSGTFRQHSVHQRGLSSTFRASVGPSLNFPCISRTFLQLPLTFWAWEGPSVIFHELSVRPRDHP